MYLTKSGITVEVIHPADIQRLKKLGYVEEKIGYPNPEVVKDGNKGKKFSPEMEVDFVEKAVKDGA